MSELEMEIPGPEDNSTPDTRERKNGVGMFMPSTGEPGVFQRIDGSMIFRDVNGAVSGLGSGAYVPQDGLANPVDQVVVGIIGSEEKPIPLFITGPPLGSEEDYLFAIASGSPEYHVLFQVSKTGEVSVSPSDPSEEALSLDSPAIDDTTVFRVAGGLGDVLVLKADGAFRIVQPAVGPVLDINNTGDITVGREDGLTGFFGGAAVAKPEVPASPTEQDIVDALVALGLVSQAA